MIEQERQALSSAPDHQARALREKLSEAIRKRSRYQEMAAEGLIDFDELRVKLSSLEETRGTAQRELEALQSRKERLAGLQHDGDALLERYAGLVPEVLDALEAEERHQLYRMLRMKVTTRAEGDLEMSGVLTGNVAEFGERETTSTRHVAAKNQLPIYLAYDSTAAATAAGAAAPQPWAVLRPLP